jgi:ribulose-phosphate 3-epimerase
LVTTKKEKMIIPAIIAKNQNELDDRLSKVMKFADIIQLDIMDNKFVPNMSLFFDFILPKTSSRFEAHLMIDDPEKWIENNWRKVDTILVHYESCNNPDNIIKKVKQHRKQIGFVVNPETPIKVLDSYLDEIDQVLIMTVNPGFYGSRFLLEMLDKISVLREMKPNLNIEVDGGITPATIGFVDKAGANMFVSGSYIVKSQNVMEAMNSLRDQLE